GREREVGGARGFRDGDLEDELLRGRAPDDGVVLVDGDDPAVLGVDLQARGARVDVDQTEPVRGDPGRVDRPAGRADDGQLDRPADRVGIDLDLAGRGPGDPD